MSDIAWFRQQYPAVRRGQTIFLDNAAGSQVPKQVIEKVEHALTELNVNTGGAYGPSRRISTLKEEVRRRTAEFVNAKQPEWVSFGPNATTLISLVAAGFARLLREDDEVVVTGLDHHANVDPWRKLAGRGVSIKTWSPREPHMTLELDDLNELITDRTKLVAMTAASNALGTFTDLRPVADRVHQVGGWLFVDAVHYAPHRLPDMEAWGADLLVASPYKFFGPHLGVLAMTEEVRETLPDHGLSFFEAGEVRNWELGTQNHEGIAGLGGTFDFLDEASRRDAGVTGRRGWKSVYDQFRKHEEDLFGHLLEGLQSRGVTIYGKPTVEGRAATVSLNVGSHPPERVAAQLGERNIAVAHGHYYAYDLMMRRLGLEERGGAVRVSIVHYNSAEEVDVLLAALGDLP